MQRMHWLQAYCVVVQRQAATISCRQSLCWALLCAAELGGCGTCWGCW